MKKDQKKFGNRGFYCLAPRSYALPRSRHWKRKSFQKLAGCCGTGQMSALEEMAKFFFKKKASHPGIMFYTAAANFWVFRAYQSGSRWAEEYLTDWFQKHPDEQMESACLNEALMGRGSGEELRALGFFFFDEKEEEYLIQGVDEDGVVEIRSYDSEDDPDEDGFGRERYYKYWYLDHYLMPVSGVECIGSFSSLDKNSRVWEEKYEKAHTAVAEAVRRREAEK